VYPVQRAPALCGVWGNVSVARLTLVCAMREDHDSNPGPTGGKTLPLAPGPPFKCLSTLAKKYYRHIKEGIFSKECATFAMKSVPMAT